MKCSHCPQFKTLFRYFVFMLIFLPKSWTNNNIKLRPASAALFGINKRYCCDCDSAGMLVPMVGATTLGAKMSQCILVLPSFESKEKQTVGHLSDLETTNKK